MFKLIRTLLLCLVLGQLPHALANDHGGGGGGGDMVTLEPITTNLAPASGREIHFVQVAITLKLSDPKAAPALAAYMPQIRHDVIMLLCSHTDESLKTTAGRKTLVDEIREAVNAVVGVPAKRGKGNKGGEFEGPVEGVFFTSFIIQ